MDTEKKRVIIGAIVAFIVAYLLLGALIIVPNKISTESNFTYNPIQEYQAQGLNQLFEIALDSEGNAWSVNFDTVNGQFVKCSPNGIVVVNTINYYQNLLGNPQHIVYDKTDNLMWMAGTHYIQSIDMEGNLGMCIDVFNSVDDLAIDTDGTMWFAYHENNGDVGIGKFLPSTKDTGMFAIRDDVGKRVINGKPSIVIDSNHYVWLGGLQSRCIVKLDKIHRYEMESYYTNPNSELLDMMIDNNDNIWFTDYLNHISKMTKDGQYTEHEIPTDYCFPAGIAINPNTQDIWITEFNGQKIAMMSQKGIFNEYNAPSESNPFSIVINANNDVWFTEAGLGRFGKMSKKEPIVIDHNIAITLIQVGKWTYGSEDAMSIDANKATTIIAEIETLDHVNVNQVIINYVGVNGNEGKTAMNLIDGNSNFGNWSGEMPMQTKSGVILFNITVISDTNKATTPDYDLQVTNVVNILEGISMTTWYYIALFAISIVIAVGILYYYRAKTGSNFWRKGKRKK